MREIFNGYTGADSSQVPHHIHGELYETHSASARESARSPFTEVTLQGKDSRADLKRVDVPEQDPCQELPLDGRRPARPTERATRRT
jgi:hypothetical protein